MHDRKLVLNEFPGNSGKAQLSTARRVRLNLAYRLRFSVAMITPPVSDPLLTALLEVAKVRFALFQERFGREPGPDEPLLFDPENGTPTASTVADSRVQVLSAAMASDVDARPVLNLLGYKPSSDV